MTGLFPPQERDLNLPTEGHLSTRAAERIVIEAATVPFDTAAMKLNHDWSTVLDGKQIQRWSERIGARAVARREAALAALEDQDVRPPCKANEHALLVIGMDGGRVQKRRKNADGTRWSEDKVLTVTSFIPGDGTDDGPGPQKLLSSYLATMQGVEKFGRLARLEAERRGVRDAGQVVLLGDGATWIDGVAQKHFPRAARIVDWYHAAEHLHATARAAHPDDESRSSECAEGLKSMLWEGKFDALMSELDAMSARAGEPPKDASPTDPREVLRTTPGYFRRRRGQMDYPAYRKRGWPIGSGITESGVKLFNKRVKGTEQFWSTEGAESILELRSQWLNDPSDLHHRLWPAPTRSAA